MGNSIKQRAYDLMRNSAYGKDGELRLDDEVGKFMPPSPRFLNLINHFQVMVDNAKRSKQVTWGAYWNGERMKSTTGKMSWNTLGAAKNAIRHAISHHVATQAGFKSSAEACQTFEKSGTLTYKQLT